MSSMSSRLPPPAYSAEPGGVLEVDLARGERIARSLDGASPILSVVIPPRSGLAWSVPAGHACRLSIVEGPQVLDLNLWSADDPRERFWAARTRQFYGPHLTVGHRLWSTLPALRPMATVIGDSVAYGQDEHGAGCHDLLGTRCDPYVSQMLSGKAYDFHCHSNLVRAIQPHGLTEYDVHDVLNVFQVTGLDPADGRYFMKTCPAQRGDHFDLLADIDLLMAASTCPGGDLSVPLWGPGSGAEPPCHPIGVEVFAVDPALLDGWHASPRASYSGAHDLRHGLCAPAEHPPLTSAVTVAADRDDAGPRPR